MPGKEKSKNSFLQFMKLLFVVAIMSSIVYFLVFNNIKASRLNRNIKTVKTQIIKQANKSRGDIIRSEEKLSSLKVRDYAKNNLGMVRTKKDDYIILR